MYEQDEIKNKLRAYMNKVFANAPDTLRNRDLKEEMTQNLLDKYNDLISEGRTPEAAYNTAISGIGDISGLLEKADTRPVTAPAPAAVPTQEKPSDQPRKKGMPLGWKIALWVIAGLVTLGLTVAAVLSVLALFNIGTVISFDSSDDSEYTACGGSTPGPVTRLTIEWVAGDVSIIPTSDDEMSFTETWDDGSEVEEADALRWSLKEDALYIRYTKRVKNLHFEQGKRLTVKVPTAWMENMYMVVDAVSGSVNVQVNADLLRINGASADVTVKGSCETLQIYTASGTAQVTGAADELTVHSASGDVAIDGQFGAADLDTASGQIRFSGSADELEIEETSGRVTLTLTEPAKTLEIDTVSGPVTVFLPDTLKGFVLDADTASADVNVHDFDVTVKKDRYTFGDGSMKFEFDSTSGDLNVYRAAGGAEGN